jgi:hypothetical protein
MERGWFSSHPPPPESRGLERLALGRLGARGVNVNADLKKVGQHLVAVAGKRERGLADIAMHRPGLST